MPASNTSSRKYSKRARRFSATIFFLSKASGRGRAIIVQSDFSKLSVRAERGLGLSKLRIEASGTSPSFDTAFRQAQGLLCANGRWGRSEEHTSELQSLMRISYAVFCLKKNNKRTYTI